MKKIFILLFLFYFHFFLFSQVIINYAVHGIPPGTITQVWTADTAAFYAGPSGMGQIWDFSYLQLDSLYNASVYFDPGTFGTDMFPTTNLTLSNSNYYDFFYEDSTEIRLVGTYYLSSGLEVDYTNSELLQSFPLAYSDSVYDPFLANYSTAIRSGVTTIVADGEGTIILPWGSFPVLRTKTLTHTVDILGANTTISDFAKYSWYSATERFPLLQFTYFLVHPSSGPNQFGKALTVNPHIVGINEKEKNELSVHVFPNPVSHICTVNYNLLKDSDIEISLSDMLGRVWKTINKEKQNGIQSETIDLSFLPKGIFLVKVQSNMGCGVTKVIKE